MVTCPSRTSWPAQPRAPGPQPAAASQFHATSARFYCWQRCSRWALQVRNRTHSVMAALLIHQMSLLWQRRPPSLCPNFRSVRPRHHTFLPQKQRSFATTHGTRWDRWPLPGPLLRPRSIRDSISRTRGGKAPARMAREWPAIWGSALSRPRPNTPSPRPFTKTLRIIDARAPGFCDAFGTLRFQPLPRAAGVTATPRFPLR